MSEGLINGAETHTAPAGFRGDAGRSSDRPRTANATRRSGGNAKRRARAQDDGLEVWQSGFNAGVSSGRAHFGAARGGDGGEAGERRAADRDQNVSFDFVMFGAWIFLALAGARILWAFGAALYAG